MSIFTQPFFSAAGQQERLSNVVNTLKASITGKGVQANTSNPTLNTALSYAASNPLTTAALITPVNTIGAAKAGFSALSTGGKIAVGIAAPIAGAAVISNPNLLVKAGNTSALSNVGANIGEFSKNPSLQTASQTFKENPIIIGGLAAAGGIILGKGITSAATSLANTAAIREQTATIKEQANGV